MPIRGFGEEEATHCPGEWIAVCYRPMCTFRARFPASGYEEARKIASGRHGQSGGDCNNPDILVGRVPDIENGE